MLTPPPSRPSRSMDAIGPRRVVRYPPTPAAVPEPTPPAFIPDPVPKHRWWRRKWVMVTAGTIIALAILPLAALAIITPPHKSNKFTPASIAVSVAKAAVEKPAALQGQEQGRTNILIYGMTKDGLRTDSIMLASYYYQQKKLVTINIPRDLYVNDGYENAKMGEVYAYAKGRQPKNSTYPDTFVASLISKEYGIPIQYWVQFNMQGEVQLVDTLGGLDINVPDSFTDCEYPTWNYSGYVRPCPSFKAGEQHMDGATALIFSRSRHSLDNGEGSDFARSKRQAIVLQAVMNKVKSMGILGNLADISKYLGILGNNVTTSLSTDEMVALAQLFKGIDANQDYLQANWATGNGFLCASTSSAGAYIVLYGVQSNCVTEAGGQQDSNYREKAVSYVQNLLASASDVPISTSPTPSPAP